MSLTTKYADITPESIDSVIASLYDILKTSRAEHKRVALRAEIQYLLYKKELIRGLK